MTGIIPFKYLERKQIETGSTTLRVDQLINSDTGFEKWVHGKKYDNLIFQKAYWIEMMKLFDGTKILDLCDADWIRHDVNIRELGDLVHAITCSSKALTDLLKSYFPEKIVEHVPDRLDLKSFPLPRERHQEKARKVVWFGYIDNANETLPQLFPVIQKAGLQLRIIADMPYAEDNYIHELDAEFILYDRSAVYEQVKEADILLNPRSNRVPFRYKSNNKSLIGWRLGLPVATTGEDVERLMNPDERNRVVAVMQPVVEQEYGIEKSAEQYREIINQIQSIKN